MNIADLRSSYGRGVLTEESAAADPFVEFGHWLEAAITAGVPEPTAMTLATVSAAGRPSSRIVLLKRFDLAAPADHARGFVWFTNYDSRKARELAVHPHAALQFHWIQQERQVRIEGEVEKVSVAESDAYFSSRPRDSQIGAWASPQSRIITDRRVIEDEKTRLEQTFQDNVPRPPHWGGYRLVPDYLEFWQGRASRLHDRLAYRKDGNASWQMLRLAP